MCQINIPFVGNAQSLLERARKEIERSGGNFDGSAEQGNFTAKTPLGSVGGTYQVIGQLITLVITKKPFLLSCNRIEKELKGVMT